MPGQIRKTRHSCKDMSEPLQDTIKFPQRRATRAFSSPAVTRKSYSLRSPAPKKQDKLDGDSECEEDSGGEKVPLKTTPKKRTASRSKIKNIENNNTDECAEYGRSPSKSPRKENGERYSSPLSEMTNSQCRSKTKSFGKSQSVKKLVMKDVEDVKDMEKEKSPCRDAGKELAKDEVFSKDTEVSGTCF